MAIEVGTEFFSVQPRFGGGREEIAGFVKLLPASGTPRADNF